MTGGWEHIVLEVRTPMFTGASVGDVEVRPTTIRGAMRFWLRALVGSVVGDDVDALGTVESAILGAFRAPSPLQVRVPAQPRISRPGKPTFADQNVDYDGVSFAGIGYLLGLGLYRWDSAAKTSRLSRGFIAPGETFEVKIRRERMSEDEWRLAQMALWLTFALGGLGMRNHRGFGGVAVRESSLRIVPPELGEVTIDRALRAPDLLTRGATPAVNAILGRDPGTPPVTATTYPALAGALVHVTPPADGGDPRFPGEWDEALGWVGLDYRLFRGNSGEQPDANYNPPVKTREWLEVLHDRNRDHFPLGTLGLPIIYRGGRKVSAYVGPNEWRWPSPLHFRLIPAGGEQRLLSIAFTSAFLPRTGGQTPQMRYTQPGPTRTLRVHPGDLEKIAHAWFRFADGHTSARPAP